MAMAGRTAEKGARMEGKAGRMEVMAHQGGLRHGKHAFTAMWP